MEKYRSENIHDLINLYFNNKIFKNVSYGSISNELLVFEIN